jgi:hypothetical protein
MKNLISVLFSMFLVIPYDDCVKISYMLEEPEDKSEYKFYLKNGRDQLDSEDLILFAAENDLKKIAVERNSKEVKIFIVEKSRGEIATESQLGKVGYVKLLVKIE